jgi:hypothetical protein
MNRRQFLRGAVGSAFALPLLSSMGSRARAVPTEFPKRLVIFYTPHGIVRKDWLVSGTETAFTLAGIPAALDPLKKDLIVTKNIDMLSADYGPGDTHQEGMGAMLGGIALLADPAGSGGIRMDSATPIGWGGGITVDQFLARSGTAVTKVPSLELGVISDFNQVGGRISYLDANKPVAPTNDPGLVFDRLFADLGADPVGIARIRAERKSVLDGVHKQFARLQTKLSKADLDKINAHAAAVRDLELRLSAPGGLVGGACMKPSRPSVAASDVNLYPTIGKLQMDLLVMALTCDLTRIASLMWSHAGPTPQAPWLGINETHHQLSHAGDLDSDAQTKLSRYKVWYAEQFAYFVKALKAVPEGEGTMLDNTVVLWCSEISVGNSHSHQDMPFILAGSCGGYFKTGRFVEYPRMDMKGVSHNNLLVSLCHAMGRTDVKTFGNPAYCSGGPLSGLAV